MIHKGSMVVAMVLLAGCATGTPQDTFEAMIQASREGRDAQTVTLAKALLGDPAVDPLVKARTEMTMALVHIRTKQWAPARAALDRARLLGVETDTGYFKDHFAEYESWIQETP